MWAEVKRYRDETRSRREKRGRKTTGFVGWALGSILGRTESKIQKQS
jgi:hypothetical protein